MTDTYKKITDDKSFIKPIELDEPIGYLEQKSMKLSIAVYKPIGWFKRLMLKWCFGLKYNRI